jgi:soluble lytic murein transglycosylase-like protein
MRAPPVLVLLGAAVLLALLRPAAAAIYAYTDERGTVHYSNVPSDPRYRLLIASPPEEGDGKVSIQTLLQRSQAYSGLIEHAAHANRLDPALVRAVIVAESACDPQATSRRGARGLMQLMPATARQYGVSNPFDPEQNIRAGSRYLRDLADRYQNDLQLVLAAYNAGPQAVDARGGAIPRFRETLDYVPRVLRIYHRLVELAEPS